MKKYSKHSLYIGIPACIFFYTISWAEKKYEYYNRKEYKAIATDE
jgi:hypothetical protein